MVNRKIILSFRKWRFVHFLLSKTISLRFKTRDFYSVSNDKTSSNQICITVQFSCFSMDIHYMRNYTVLRQESQHGNYCAQSTTLCLVNNPVLIQLSCALSTVPRLVNYPVLSQQSCA